MTIPGSFKARLVVILTVSQVIFLSSLLGVGYYFINSTIKTQIEKQSDSPIADTIISNDFNAPEFFSKNAFLILLAACLVELTVATMLALFIGRYVGKRSNYLVQGIKKYADGDIDFQYQHITKDEFGIIAATFNEMARKINEDSRNLDLLRLQNLENSKMAALGEMASGIAHEINNPLTVVVAKSAMMARQIKGNLYDPESFEAELIKIQNTAKRITKIINGLRTFSRNAENDPMEKMNITKIIEDSLSFCTERFKSHQVALKVQLEVTPSLPLLGRPTQISQVILNLLNNAFDAVESLPEKWIELKVNSTETTLVVRVTDSGHGIPPEVVSKLMEPFFTTKAVGKGTGLGLSISKNIIESHKGRFYYDSQSANTSFILELPLAANDGEIPGESNDKSTSESPI